MPADGVIIECAMHELVSKSANPHVPYGPEELGADAAACVDAGATLLHFHARDPQTGEQRWHDDGLYRETLRIMGDIGVAADLPWYPTYPGMRPGVAIRTSMSHVEALAGTGTGTTSAALQLAAVDIGSWNLSPYDATRRQFLDPDSVKVLPHSLFEEFAGFCRDNGLRPYLGVYEPGHLRHLAAYLEQGWIDAPLMIKFFFSEHHPYGLPAVARSVEMYAEILDVVLPGVTCTWFVQCYGPRIWDLAPAALGLGGHVRVGLGDIHPWDWPDTSGAHPTNAELVGRAAKLAVAAGRPVTTVAETRDLLGLS